MVFGVSTFNAYAYYAWLPQILVSEAGLNRIDAGALLSLYAALSLPAALIIPGLSARLKHPALLAVWAGVFIVVGNVGLILVPATATLLWVVIAGAGPLLFPLCLTLINRLTANEKDAAALAGFSQGVGYALGALGPLLIGYLHSASGAWTPSLAALLLTGFVAAAGGLVLNVSRR